MQGQNQQQAYDRGITIFSPDGRLYQVEYAREAVKRGSAAVGVRTDEGVVLAAEKRTGSDLLEADSIEKLHVVDDHVGVATAGHVADARKLVDFARRRAQGERLRFDEPADVETLTTAITDQVQEHTQTGGARPFGVSLLVAGVDGDRTRLFETDPSGTSYEWKATAVGGDSDDLRAFLEEEYDPDADLEGGICLALRTLAQPDEEAMTASEASVAVVDADGYRELSRDEVADHLATEDLLADDED
jgi:proteasome alpha subunit